ncbi:MAG: protein kinase [Sandaracinaceae bacterium]
MRFKLFGRYLLLERLAVGGMAEVYVAKRVQRGGTVGELLAIKRILPTLAKEHGFIRMFLDEAQIAGRLSHPGIARLFELGRVGDAHYLAMELVWGKDVLAIVRRCRALDATVSPWFAAEVGAQLCEALHAAHTATDRHGEPMHVIHRDVSPQNVLVGFDGRVRVIDFGIAKAQARLTRTQSGLLKGKVGYMSPEQIVEKEVDHRSDLFAVSTCLYELLTRRSLFSRENGFEAMENVRHVRMQPIRALMPDVPEALEAILLKGHAKDPADRYKSGLEMASAFRRFLASGGPEGDPSCVARWMDDAFKKEVHEERRRLDALDQVGRPQVSIQSDGRPSELPVLVPPADLGGLGREPVEGAPTEVFFSHFDSSPDGRGGPRSSLLDDDDLAFDVAQLSSGLIKKLAVEATPSGEDADTAEEPTADRTVPDDVPTRSERPPGRAAERVEPSRRPGSAAWWALSALFLVVGAAAMFAYYQYFAPARVDVRTEPSVGAVVLFDGVSQGPAPVHIDDVEPGTHTVTVVAGGYAPVTRELEVRPSSSAHIDIALTPSTTP